MAEQLQVGKQEIALGPSAERVVLKRSSLDYSAPFLERSIHIHEHVCNKFLSPKSRRKPAVHNYMG